MVTKQTVTIPITAEIDDGIFDGVRRMLEESRWYVREIVNTNEEGVTLMATKGDKVEGPSRPSAREYLAELGQVIDDVGMLVTAIRTDEVELYDPETRCEVTIRRTPFVGAGEIRKILGRRTLAAVTTSSPEEVADALRRAEEAIKAAKG